MLRPQLLIHLKLFLRFILLSGVYISLPEPIVRVGEIWFIVQCLTIFGNRLRLLRLVRVKISQLQMRLGELGVKRDRLPEE